MQSWGTPVCLCLEAGKEAFVRGKYVPAYSVDQPGGEMGPSCPLPSPQDGHSESVAGQGLPIVTPVTSDGTSYWVLDLSCLNPVAAGTQF